MLEITHASARKNKNNSQARLFCYMLFWFVAMPQISNRNNSYNNERLKNDFHTKKLERHMECRGRQGVLQQYIREQWADRINQISMNHDRRKKKAQCSSSPLWQQLHSNIREQWTDRINQISVNHDRSPSKQTRTSKKNMRFICPPCASLKASCLPIDLIQPHTIF